MQKRLIIASAVLAIPMLVIGCDQPAESPPATPAGSTNQPSSAVDRTTGALSGAAGSAASSVQGAIGTQLDQVGTYIQQGKLELAEQALSKAEQQKAQLPAALQTRMEQLRQRLDDAKKAAPTGTVTPTTSNGVTLP